MKTFCTLFIALLLVGCATTRPTASLTAEQAEALALRLANDKAETVYQCRPFRDGQPAQFVSGHWVWADHAGFGKGDLQAIVELAGDGSTHAVDLQFLNNTIIHAARF